MERIKQLINDYNDLSATDATEAEENLALEVEQELAQEGYYTYKDASGQFSYAAKDGTTQEGRIDPDPDHHYPN